MVEETGEGVAHGGGGLDHQEEHQVKREELGEGVGQANGEVVHAQEEEGHEEHDRQLGNQLGSGVHPDIVHARGAFTSEDGLLSLEYNNSGLEIEEHLHDCHEVDGARHVLDFFDAISIVVDLPESTHHQKGHDHGLDNFGARKSRLALC